MADNNLDLFAGTDTIEPQDDTKDIQGLDLFADEKGLDLFADEKIEPVSITEQNTNAIKAGSTLTPEQKQFQDDDSNQWNKIAESRFTPERIEWMKNNPIGFWDSKDFLDLNQVVPGGGLSQAWDAGKLYNIGQKRNNGENLSDSEQELLNDYTDKQAEMKLRGFTVGGNVSYYGAQVPAFATEFALSGGTGKLAQKAATTAATKIAQKTALKGITKGVTTKSIGVAANVAGRTLAMPARVVSSFGERRLTDTINITDKGDVLTREATENPIKAGLMSYAYTSGEVASEMSGATLGKYLVKPVAGALTRVLKTPLTQGVSKLSPAVQNALYRGYQATRPNAKLSKVFSQVGWNGMLEEMGEEEIGRVLSAGIGLTGGDITVQDAIDEIQSTSNDRLATAGIVAIFGSVSSSARVVANSLTKKGFTPEEAKEITDNMTQEELDTKSLEEFPLPQSEYNTDIVVKTDSPEIIEARQETEITSSIQAGVSNIDIESNQKIEPPMVLDQESGFNNGFKPILEKAKEVKDWVIFELVNDKRMLESLSPDVQQSIRSFHGIAGKIRQNLEVGIYGEVDGKREIIGKSLKNITDDWNNYLIEYEPSMEVRLQDQNAYLRSRRILEDLVDREDVEVTEAQNIDAITQMARLTDKYKDNMQFFDTFSKELYENQKQILHQLVDAGVMSEESYKAITKANPNYVPFNRIIEDDTFIGFSKKAKFTDAKAGIEKIKGGSDLEVDNFLRSITLNTGKIIVAAERNKVAANIKDVLVSMGEAEKSKPLLKEKTVDGKKVLKPSKQKPQGTFSVFEDGEKVFYKTNDSILREIESMDPNVNEFMAKLLRPLQVSGQIFRAGATGLNPEFWAKNFIRDTVMVNLQSKVNPNAVDAVKGVFAVLGKTDVYNKWEEGGGSFDSYMGQNLKDMDSNLEEIYKEIYKEEGKIAKYLKNPLKGIEDVGDVVEKANRLGVYQKSIEKGLTEKEAVFESRDASLDFAVGGRTGKVINRYIPFFNAGIRGTAKLADTIRKNPTAFMYHGITRLTLPTIMYNYYMLYEAPDDEREEYLELPNWRRMIAWNIKIGDSWVSIPKPFAPGQLFATIPEMMMLDGFKGDKPESKEMAIDIIKNVAGSLSPIQDLSGVLPPMLKWSIENMTNHNFFTGRSLYPDWMDSLEPRDRSNKYTPEVLKLLGDKLNVSPAKLDNALKGTFAGSARFFTDASDKVLKEVKEWNGEEVLDKPRQLADIPLIRSFVKRSPDGYGSKSVQNFFADWDKAQEVHASFGRRTGEEKKNYFDKNKNAILSYKPLKAFNKQMKSVRDQIDMIYDNKSMKSETKVDKIKVLEKQITDIARVANKQLLKIREK